MESLIAKVNNVYNIEVQSTEKVTRGFLSENHILYSKDKKYFLKRYRFDTQERIEEVHSTKKYFADGGIPVILPITNTEGNTFFYFDNGYFALFPFVLDSQPERGSLTNTEITSLGETLGRIHLLGKMSNLVIKERFKPWNKNKLLEKIELVHKEIKKQTDITDFDRLALQSIETKKKLVENNLIVYEDLNLSADHLIHGDYLDQNVFFGIDDKVSYVFDFEKTDYSPRTYELFRSLMYTFLSGDITEEEIGKAKLYLNAYLSIYPTTKDELTRGLKLFYLKSIHGMWVETEHYLNKSNRVDIFLLHDFRRIQYLSNNLKTFQDALFADIL